MVWEIIVIVFSVAVVAAVTIGAIKKKRKGNVCCSECSECGACCAKRKDVK